MSEDLDYITAFSPSRLWKTTKWPHLNGNAWPRQVCCTEPISEFGKFMDNDFKKPTAKRDNIRKWPVPGMKVPPGHLMLHHKHQHAMLLKGACQDPSMLFFHTNGLVYFSFADNFENHLNLLTVPETVLKGSSEVISAAFSMSNLLLVIEGTVLRYDCDTGVVTPAAGIDNNVTDVVTFQCCYSQRQWCQEHSHIVVAYNKKQEGTAQVIYYISYDAGLQFHAKQMAASHQGNIYGATILHAYSEVAFLTKTSSSTAHFIHSSYNHKRTAASESLEFVAESDGLAFVQLHSGIGSLLIWNDRQIFYSLSSGQAVLPVEVMSSSGALEHSPLDGQQVQQVISDSQGNFALITNQDVIFFGREGILSQAVELDVTLPCNSSCVLYWTDSGHLGIMFPVNESSSQSSNSLQFHFSVINIQEQLRMIGSLAACPYQAFQGDFHTEIFYADIGMDVDIQGTFIPEMWQQNWFMIGVSNPGILDVESYSYTEGMLATGLTAVTVNVGVDLVASSLPNGSKEAARGSSGLWMTAMNTSLMCPQNPLLVAQVAAECPPYKRIRVRNEETSCAEMKSYSYVIRKEDYDASFLQGSEDSSNQEDKTIFYDYATLGCPVKVYYANNFKPTVDLYHDDVFIEQVLVDYVLYEIHGVVTYGYTKTVSKVGCVSASQSWLSMLKQQNIPDPATAWTRENYHSCMANGSAIEDPNQPYEVLSNKTTNALHWSDYNTIYVFQVTVVDPDYSFCHLTTQFAVQVYGALPKAAVPPLRIMLATCGLGLVVLIVGFIVHKVYEGGGEEEEEEQSN